MLLFLHWKGMDDKWVEKKNLRIFYLRIFYFNSEYERQPSVCFKKSFIILYAFKFWIKTPGECLFELFLCTFLSHSGKYNKSESSESLHIGLFYFLRVY